MADDLLTIWLCCADTLSPRYVFTLPTPRTPSRVCFTLLAVSRSWQHLCFYCHVWAVPELRFPSGPAHRLARFLLCTRLSNGLGDRLSYTLLGLLCCPLPSIFSPLLLRRYSLLSVFRTDRYRHCHRSLSIFVWHQTTCARIPLIILEVPSVHSSTRHVRRVRDRLH